MTTEPALDNPVWAALSGPQAGLGEAKGLAARFQPDVSPFAAVGDLDDPAAWDDLAALAGPGGTAALFAASGVPPAGWEVLGRGPAVQLVEESVAAKPDPQARALTPADVPAMLDLVARTQPGPFLPRTIDMGAYLGIFDGAELVAMAGERLRPPGWTEISAVCTAKSHRGQGLGTRLVLAVAAGIRARGERALMHAAGTNTNAIRLYRSLGFQVRREPTFWLLRAPAAVGADAGAERAGVVRPPWLADH